MILHVSDLQNAHMSSFNRHLSTLPCLLNKCSWIWGSFPKFSFPKVSTYPDHKQPVMQRTCNIHFKTFPLFLYLPAPQHTNRGKHFPRLSLLFISFLLFLLLLFYHGNTTIETKQTKQNQKIIAITKLGKKCYLLGEKNINWAFTECQELNTHDLILIPWKIYRSSEEHKGFGARFGTDLQFIAK